MQPRGIRRDAWRALKRFVRNPHSGRLMRMPWSMFNRNLNRPTGMK